MRAVLAVVLLLAPLGLAGCKSGICEGGCVCFSSESQCASEGCERVYTRQPNGSLKYDGCTNGPGGMYVLDAGTISDASSQ